MSDWLRMHELADAQLPPEQKKPAESLLSDPKMKAEYESVILIKSTLRCHCKPLQPEEELWQTCRKRLKAIDKANRVEKFVGRNAWALCGVVFIIVVGAGFLNRLTGGNALHPSDVARLSASLSLVPFSSSEPSNDLSAFLNSTFPRSPVRPNLNDWRLHKMESGQVEGRRAARVCLDDGRGCVMLYIVENTHRLEGMQTRQMRRAYAVGHLDNKTMAGWLQDAYALILVGDRSCDELIQIAERICIKG